MSNDDLDSQIKRKRGAVGKPRQTPHSRYRSILT